MESSSIVQDGPGWSGFIRDGQSNFIKLFDAGLQCEFIRTFFSQSLAFDFVDDFSRIYSLMSPSKELFSRLLLLAAKNFTVEIEVIIQSLGD